MDTLQEKLCTGCGLTKSLDKFHNDKSKKYGKHSRCKLCQNKGKKERDAKNPERLRAYYAALPTRPKIIRKEKACTKCKIIKPIDEFGRSAHAKDLHTTHCLACKRIANDANEAKRRAAYFAKQEEKKQYARDRYLVHKIKMNQQSAAWAKANPELAHSYANLHASRKRGAAISDLTAAQWLEIQEAQGHRCYYCGKRCKGKLTRDHLTPLSKGGNHTLHNVIAVCRSCNSKKHIGPPLKPVQPFLLTIAPARDSRKKVNRHSTRHCVQSKPPSKARVH